MAETKNYPFLLFLVSFFIISIIAPFCSSSTSKDPQISKEKSTYDHGNATVIGPAGKFEVQIKRGVGGGGGRGGGGRGGLGRSGRGGKGRRARPWPARTGGSQYQRSKSSAVAANAKHGLMFLSSSLFILLFFV